MDEPLSNLDAQLRTQMRRRSPAPARTRCHDDVRHARPGRGDDDGDADRGDAKGRPPAAGAPQALYDPPDNLFVATFIGSPTMNLLQGRIERDGDAFSAFSANSGCRTDERRRRSARRLRGQGRRRWGAPEHLTDPTDGPHDRPRMRGRVKLVELLGSEQLVQIQLDAEPVVADALLEVARDMDATAAEAILGRTKSEGRS